MKAVLHIDLEDKSRVSTALGNTRNFLEQTSGQASDLRLVINHNAVKFFTRAAAGDFTQAMERLADDGVRFLICSNSLQALDINPADLLSVCEVVPAGIVELIRLQQEGFAYVKP